MTTNLIDIKDLHVTLGDNSILKGVNATLLRGQITAVIGLNGSGKTTLLRAILKEVPYTGSIKFHCGHDHSKPVPRHIGYVPQKLQIDAKLPLTVRDLMALALQRWPLFLGISRQTQKAMDELLDKVGGGHFKDYQVEKLSGGQLQRVLLALALHPQPELLLLDEPAAGIDFKDQDKFYHLLGDLNKQIGVTIVLVSHDIGMVPRHAHHVLCLRDGQIKCQGPPQQVITEENLAQIFGSEKGLFAHQH